MADDNRFLIDIWHAERNDNTATLDNLLLTPGMTTDREYPLVPEIHREKQRSIEVIKVPPSKRKLGNNGCIF